MSGSGGTVTWRRLELHGFGRHVSLEVAFADGLTTLVAPNEFGKSTLVAGLVATLFGLPHVSDPTKFGRERFRNWANPSRFEGEVDFTGRDGVRYTLHRNFETHEVRIVRHAGLGAEEVFEGTHNPIARTGGEGYEAHLEALLGMTDREAFRQSFHVAQPLPAPEQLGDEVQRLLSGSGQGTFDAALGALEDAVKARTSATGDLGVTARNQRNPRELEQLEERIADLQRALREGRDAADRAKEVGSELAELEAERTRLQAKAKELGARVQAHRAWLARKDAYTGAAKSHRELQDAVGQAKGLSERIDARSASIHREWPEFDDVREDLEVALLAAKAAEDEFHEAEEALRAANDSLEARRVDASERAEALNAHLENGLAEPGRWGPDRLRELRRDAEQAVRDWDRYRTRAHEIARREQDLERFGPLEDVDDATLELLRGYSYEHERRTRAVADEARALETTANAPRGAGNPLLRLAVAALLALAAGGIVFALTNLAWGLLAALLAGAAGYGLGPGRPGAPRDAPAPHPTGAPGRDGTRDAPSSQRAPARRELDAFVEATRPYVESLRDLGGPGEAVRAWEHARRDLEQERQLQAEHTQRIWDETPDRLEAVSPASLSGAWRDLADYAEAHGARAEDLEGLATWLRARDEEAWNEEIQGAERATRERTAWEDRRVELAREADRADTRLQEAEGRRDRARAAMEEARLEADAARAEIEELLSATGATPNELLHRWRAYRAASAELDGMKGRLAGLLNGRGADSIAQLSQQEYDAGMQVLEIRNAVEALRETHPELPPLSAERRDVAQALTDLEHAAEQAIATAEEVGEQAHQLGMQKSQLEGKELVNIAQAELDLAESEAERERLSEEIGAHVLAHQELSAAIQAYQSTHRERLERLATTYLRSFSGAEGRRVALGEGFEVFIVESGGTRAHPGQLSQGTQDQLLLALRLAIADHLSDDAPLPLLLDDPFLNWDADRLAQVRAALGDLADERQVVLLSHRDDFATWGEPTDVR